MMDVPCSQDERLESTPDDWRAAVSSVHVEQPYCTHAAGSYASTPASHVAASHTTSTAPAAARLRLPPPPNPFDLPPPTDWLAPSARGGRGAEAPAHGEGDGEWERSVALAEYSACDARLPPSTPSRKQHARTPAAFAAAEEEAFNGGWDEDEDDKLQLCESMFQPVEEPWSAQRRARRASECDASVRGGGGGGGAERGALRPDGSHYVRKQPEYLMMQIVRFQKRIAGVNPDTPCTRGITV